VQAIIFQKIANFSFSFAEWVVPELRVTAKYLWQQEDWATLSQVDLILGTKAT